MNNESDTPKINPKIEEWVNNYNDKLVISGSESAEQAFGLVITYGMIGIIILTGILFISKITGLIFSIIIFLLSAIILTGFSGLIALNARNTRIKQIIKSSLEGEINNLISNYETTKADINFVIKTTLPENSPLYSHQILQDHEII